MRKRLIRAAAVLAAAVAVPAVLGGCSGKTESAGTAGAAAAKTEGGQMAGTDEGKKETGEKQESGEVEKPEKIKILVSGSFQATKTNGQEEWIKRYEELTGVKLEVIQPDHDAYLDVLGQTFASGPENWPDVVAIGSTYYTGYAKEGALWDMTDAWNNSELKKSGRVKDSNPIDGNAINGRYYGLSPERGNGCITYVKKKWLDNCGLEVPANYEEYINMLDAFTKGDPDGDGIDGNTYGVSAAGLIGAEAPYVNYLPEFYQDAFPAFYQKEDGTWADGFTEDAMKGAIGRLQDAYEKGYLDKETLTNGTKDCRNKFYEDKFGVFTYWAGTWSNNLKTNLEANGLDGELAALPPILEVGKYYERNAPVYAITAKCKNPEGVFKYFIENMLDGGDVQTLWSYGVEDIHWSVKAGTVCGNSYKEGEFHMLENREQPGTQFTKLSLDPLLAVADLAGKDPGAALTAPEAKNSQLIFNENSKQAPLPVTTDMMSQYNGDLTTLKNSIIADCVVQGLPVEEGYARFEKEHGNEWSQAIVDSLNEEAY